VLNCSIFPKEVNLPLILLAKNLGLKVGEGEVLIVLMTAPAHPASNPLLIK